MPDPSPFHDPNGQPVPDPTPEEELAAAPPTAEQIAAAERDGEMFLDLLLKMEMGDAALLAVVTALLGSFQGFSDSAFRPVGTVVRCHVTGPGPMGVHPRRAS